MEAVLLQAAAAAGLGRAAAAAAAGLGRAAAADRSLRSATERSSKEGDTPPRQGGGTERRGRASNTESDRP